MLPHVWARHLCAKKGTGVINKLFLFLFLLIS
jgi:hypothetical protein